MLHSGRSEPEGTVPPNGLAQAMAMAGIDAPTLARLADVGVGDVRAWARGQRDLRPVMATRLSVHLQTTAADLLIGLGGGEPPGRAGGLSRPDVIALSSPAFTASRPGRFVHFGDICESLLVLSAVVFMLLVGCVALLD